jgi:hypothetical protein
VTISGGDLDGVPELRASHPGITATLKSGDSFIVSVAGGVPPGVYDLRAVGKNGASNPRAFAVGVLAEIAQTPDSHDPAKVQAVPLDSTINGRAAEGAVDRYRVRATKGEWIIASCQAAELDSRFEPVLEVNDADGLEVARARQGGTLRWRVREEGDFTISLHDIIYRGGSEYFYRISVGAFPDIESAFPVAAGDTSVRFVLLGRNFRDAPGVSGSFNEALERLEVSLSPRDPNLSSAFSTMPSQAPLSLYDYRLKTPRGISPPVLLDLPGPGLVVGSQTNLAPGCAQKLWPPCVVAGEFPRNRKSSWFSFDAHKGDVLWVEVLSQRLHFPSDPFLVIRKASADGKGGDSQEFNDDDENIGGNAFNTKSRDPRGRFEAAADGEYRLQIRDLFTHDQSASAAGYQLILRKPEPDFELAVTPAMPPRPKDSKDLRIATVALRKNGVLPLRVYAFRGEGFDGPIALSVKGLPGGVKAHPAILEPGQSTGLIWLDSGKETVAANVAVTVTGIYDTDRAQLVRQARPVTLVWNVDNVETAPVRSRSCAECLVSALPEEQPIRLRPAEQKIWDVLEGAKLELPLVLERAPDCEFENFKVTPFGDVRLEAADEFEIKGNATNLVFSVDAGKLKLALGTHVFALHGSVKGKRKKPAESNLDFSFYSVPVTLHVSAASTNSPAK